MKAALLPDRGVVAVAGDDARKFLNGLVTADVGELGPGDSRFAALLTPQGKIIVDFIIVGAPAGDGGGLLLDCPRTLAGALVERLEFYKLRARLLIEDRSEHLGVIAVWDDGPAGLASGCYRDPRLAELGSRAMVAPHLAAETAGRLGADLVDHSLYEAHRVRLGIPRGGLDFGYGDAYPHEADMDQLGGVDFHKGCFIGQEVVSRVEHRGTARNRVVPVRYDGDAPAAGMRVSAGERAIGTLGSTAQGRGLAMLRLDRAADALAAGQPLQAAGVEIRLVKPAWARFAFPGDVQAAK